MLESSKASHLRRSSLTGDGTYQFVPLDHAVSDGPVVPAGQWDGLLRTLVSGGAEPGLVTDDNAASEAAGRQEPAGDYGTALIPVRLTRWPIAHSTT